MIFYKIVLAINNKQCVLHNIIVTLKRADRALRNPPIISADGIPNDAVVRGA